MEDGKWCNHIRTVIYECIIFAKQSHVLSLNGTEKAHRHEAGVKNIQLEIVAGKSNVLNFLNENQCQFEIIITKYETVC